MLSTNATSGNKLGFAAERESSNFADTAGGKAASPRAVNGLSIVDTSPSNFLRALLHSDGFCSPAWTAEDQKRQFKRNEAYLENYTVEAVNAVRSMDVSKLERLLKEGNSFDACNKTGEYLIHLACRRANAETVRFLVQQAGVSITVRDGIGRTILHDVCWKSSPDLHLMQALLPFVTKNLLFAPDQRGHTPFDYARREHWVQWNRFLLQHQDIISALAGCLNEDGKFSLHHH